MKESHRTLLFLPLLLLPPLSAAVAPRTLYLLGVSRRLFLERMFAFTLLEYGQYPYSLYLFAIV